MDPLSCDDVVAGEESLTVEEAPTPEGTLGRGDARGRGGTRGGAARQERIEERLVKAPGSDPGTRERIVLLNGLRAGSG